MKSLTFFSLGEIMKFPLEVYLIDTSEKQENGLRTAVAKNNKDLKALKAGGYILEKPEAKEEKKPSKSKK